MGDKLKGKIVEGIYFYWHGLTMLVLFTTNPHKVPPTDHLYPFM